MIYGMAVYVLMYWVVLRGLLSGTSSSYLGANPEWSGVLVHLMFGAILGLLIAYGPFRRQVAS